MKENCLWFKLLLREYEEEWNIIRFYAWAIRETPQYKLLGRPGPLAARLPPSWTSGRCSGTSFLSVELVRVVGVGVGAANSAPGSWFPATCSLELSTTKLTLHQTSWFLVMILPELHLARCGVWKCDICFRWFLTVFSFSIFEWHGDLHMLSCPEP
jgi:hypothetical protein